MEGGERRRQLKMKERGRWRAARDEKERRQLEMKKRGEGS